MSTDPDDLDETREKVISAVREYADALGAREALCRETAARHTSTESFCRECEESLAVVWRSNTGAECGQEVSSARIFWKETFRHFALTQLHGGGLVIRQIGNSGSFRCTVTRRAPQSELWERLVQLAHDMDMDFDDIDEVEYCRDRALKSDRAGRQQHTVARNTRDPAIAHASTVRHRTRA